MKTVRRLSCAVAMTVVLGLLTPALAQSGCNPGEMLGPPCATTQLVTDDPIAPGEMVTPPAAETIDISTVVEEALITLLLF